MASSAITLQFEASVLKKDQEAEFSKRLFRERLKEIFSSERLKCLVDPEAAGELLEKMSSRRYQTGRLVHHGAEALLSSDPEEVARTLLKIWLEAVNDAFHDGLQHLAGTLKRKRVEKEIQVGRGFSLEAEVSAPDAGPDVGPHSDRLDYGPLATDPSQGGRPYVKTELDPESRKKAEVTIKSALGKDMEKKDKDFGREKKLQRVLRGPELRPY